MNTVEQIVGSYGRFSYNPDKKKNSVELGDEFEKLFGSQEGRQAAAVENVTLRAVNDISESVPTGSEVVLYLYNFLGEITISEPLSGANVNKLV